MKRILRERLQRLHRTMTELNCTQCRFFLNGRCSLFQNNANFKQWLRIQETRECSHFWPSGIDRPETSICDTCEYLGLDGMCNYFKSPCDRRDFRVQAIRTGSCCYYSKIGERAARYVGSPIAKHVFITVEDLTKHTIELAGRLPRLDAIIAVPRSGLMPGSILATILHVPLYAISPMLRHVTYIGNGHRLGRQPQAPSGNVLVIDDTASHGGTLAEILAALKGQVDLRKVYTAAIYASPKAAEKLLDFVAHVYPQPHFLEWCFVNTFWAIHLAFDFDGIICAEPTTYDAAPEYRHFLSNARPLYLPKMHAPIIVSARCDWTRHASLDWLTRHGITPKKLILWDGDPDARWATPDTVAIWKAKQLATLRHTDQIKLYAESDPGQAATIAEAAKMPVICPVARRVFGIEYLPDL